MSGSLAQRCASWETVDTTTSDVGTAFKRAIDRGEAGRIPWIISTVLWSTDLGSLNGLVAKLKQGGLGGQVASWLGNDLNLPVTAKQLRAALGDEHVQQIATQLRVPPDEALKLLCETLPCAVDRASPNGSLPPGA
jgi:uncharacterized protein YidB (DUF937 family)